MSSHREAPEISKDPVADSTDTYAFVTPNHPSTVTMITNYIPLQNPAGGPNFFEFGDDVSYKINVDNNGDGVADVVYEFRFTTTVGNPDTFLYNTGPIGSLSDPNWNRRQVYSVTRTNAKGTKVLGENLTCPPCNIGPRSTPKYAQLAKAAVHRVEAGKVHVFAGQRLDGFYVDLGSVFDLADLRPFQHLHLIPTSDAPGVDGLKSYNVHTIALTVPISELTVDGTTPTDYSKPNAVIGVWASASRQMALVRNPGGADTSTGPWVQVSRLGNPLVNEALIPMSKKDLWNSLGPDTDAQFDEYVAQPELARLIPVLYPGVFPNLGAYTNDRADLEAILVTGIPNGIIDGFQNFTGTTHADELRLNVAIPPSSNPNIMGILGGDLAGYPNGRRVFDDVFTIELQAIAGATIPLVDPSFTPDGAVSVVADGVTPPGNVSYSSKFPFLDVPKSGFDLVPAA
jgi:Domain of unknown function (DUF4331)